MSKFDIAEPDTTPVKARFFCADVRRGFVLVLPFELAGCGVQTMKDYTGFAGNYVHDCERQWLARPGLKEALLGTPDLRSSADLDNSVNIARSMRPAPVSKRLGMQLLVAALLPLLLPEYPVAELIGMIIERLSDW